MWANRSPRLPWALSVTLKALAALQEDQGLIPSAHRVPQPSLTPVPGDPTPSSEFRRHSADTHAGTALRHRVVIQSLMRSTNFYAGEHAVNPHSGTCSAVSPPLSGVFFLFSVLSLINAK